MTSATTSTASTAGSGYLRTEDCHLDDLLAIIGAGTDLAQYPHATEVAHGVLLYDADAVRDAMTDDEARRAVHAEVARALADGPGIAVFRGAFEHEVVDRATEVFEQVIAQEKAAGRAAGCAGGVA